MRNELLSQAGVLREVRRLTRRGSEAEAVTHAHLILPWEEAEVVVDGIQDELGRSDRTCSAVLPVVGMAAG